MFSGNTVTQSLRVIELTLAEKLMSHFLRGERTQVIALQEQGRYRKNLLVFVDDQHRIAEGGVFYCSFLPFEDGDQDLLLGLIKKTLGSRWEEAKSSLLVSSWNDRHEFFQIEEVVVFTLKEDGGITSSRWGLDNHIFQ